MPPASTLGLLAKDVGIAANLMRSVNLDAPVAAQINERYKTALAPPGHGARQQRSHPCLGQQQPRVMTMEKKKVDVGAVIDSANYFWVPFGITVMMIIIMLTDGYDLFLMGHVGNLLVKDWGITRANLGPINTAGMLGMAVGSVTLGWLGDRIGRKRSYFTCLIFLFIGSVLCYFTAKSGTPATAMATIDRMTIWRFVTGLGMGGVTPLATTLISEWTSQRVRSVIVALVISSVPVGGSLAGLAIKHVEWQQMFLIGGLVPLALFMLFRIPAAGVAQVHGAASGVARAPGPCAQSPAG